MRRWPIILTALVATACPQRTFDPEGHVCEAGSCLTGYICSPFSVTCVQTIPVGCNPGQICPSATQDGDTCAPAGAFLPCTDGATGCDPDCRECQDDLTWGPCVNPTCTPTNPPTEACDGVDNDCDGVIDGEGADGCTTYYRDDDSDGVGQTNDSRCLCAATDPHDATTAGDCRDDDNACGADCSTCVPRSFNATNDGPANACDPITVSLALDGLAERTAQLSCSVANFPVSFAGFESDLAPWTTNANTTLRNWPGGFPTPSCSLPGGFVSFDRNAAASIELAAPIDVTSVPSPEIRFTAGYKGTPAAGEDLVLEACCGAGCTPALLGSVPNAASGGSNECQSYGFALTGGLETCDALYARVSFNGSDQAGVDSLQVGGPLVVAPITDNGGGSYSATVTTCAVAEVVVDCVWDDGTHTPLQSSTTLVFE